MNRRILSHLGSFSLLAFISSGAITACSADGGLSGPGDEAAEGAERSGTVGLQLKLGDATLNSVTYAITGNGFTKTGAIDVSKSKTISTTIGGIPAGSNYSITLSGTDMVSGIVCGGSASFNVTARATTVAVIKLECRLPASSNGSVKIDGSANVCPRIDALSVEPAEVIVGSSMALSSAITDQDSLPAPATYAWSANGGAITGAALASASFKCTAAGSFEITLLVSDTLCSDTAKATVTCSPDPNATVRPNVKINEVESNGGTPGDWTELVNLDATPADISGWTFKDNDDTHAYVLPSGTIIPAGGYFTVEEAAQSFGLGGADSVRLYDSLGALVDSYTWTAHATITYGRCPNGTGDFGQTSSTKGAANSCVPTTPVPPSTAALWPGTNDVKIVDVASQWTSNLSGLTYEPATSSSSAALWAVVNGPGTLYRLVWNGTNYLPDTANDFGAGKALHYPNGLGNPDSEGVTFGASFADGIYVATERNNDASTTSRSAILRFDPSAAGASLTATHDFNLTALLPVVGANLGIEAVTWVSDAYLTSKGFFDAAAGHTYVPSEYPDHGTGLFLVGLEGGGKIYAFALNHATGTASLLATIVSGQTGVMGLEFDRDLNYLWFSCDDTCGNKSGIFDIDTTIGSATKGQFILKRLYDRPSTLPDSNNEGIAIGSECVSGFKPFFWSDDNDKDGFSLRKDAIPCTSLL